MARLILPQKYSIQPQGAAFLDPSNPITRGIIDAFLPIGNQWRSVPWANGLPDITSAQDQTFLADSASTIVPAFGASQWGALVGKNYGADRQSVRTTSKLAGITEATLLTLCLPLATSTLFSFVFSYASSANNNAAFMLGQGGSAGKIVFYCQNDAGTGQTTDATPGPGWTNGSASLLIGTRSQLRNFYRLYHNGQTVIDTTATTLNTTTLDRCGFGAWMKATPANKFNGYAFLGVAWDRSLSPAEVNALSVNPWQVFAPQAPKFYVNSSAAAFVAAPMKPILQAVNRAGTY